MSIKFQWIGGPTFVLEAGGFRLLTDPMFAEGNAAFTMNGHPSTGEGNVPISRRAALPHFDLSPLDGVLLSHLHSDHFDSVAASRLDKNLTLLAPPAQLEALAGRGFRNLRGLDWWQEWVLEKGAEKLRITSVPARHSHDEQTNADLGIVNGFIFEYITGERVSKIYWTGDTVWFDGMDKIKQFIGKTDLLIPHLGAVGIDGPWGMMTLNGVEARRVVELFEPQAIIPIHHHTFSHYVESVDEFRKQIESSAFQGRLVILEEGQSVDLDNKMKQR